VLDSSRQIWLAGLGAFSRAQEEGAKVFDTLVKQGEAVESKTRRAAADTAAAASGAARTGFAEVQKNVSGTWDKLEQVFEDRVARTLSKLGVSMRDDVQRLEKRVDAVAAAVDGLTKAQRASGAHSVSRRRSEEATGNDGSTTAKSLSRAARTATKRVQNGNDELK